MNQSALNRKSKTKYHQQSLDNIMKQIRKINLKSQRHLSPKHPLYMYSKNQNTYHTLQRSRSLSNRRSNSKKSKKTLRINIQKILQIKLDDVDQNPGSQIQKYSQLIKKVQKTIKKKNQSTLSVYLCQKFQQMLANIVQNMLMQLNQRIKDLQETIKKKVQQDLNNQYQAKQYRLKKYIIKLESKTKQLIEKQNYNNRIIYALRKGDQQTCQVDIDKVFRKLHGIQPSSIHGYKQKSIENNSQIIESQSQKQQDMIYQNQHRILKVNQQMKNENISQQFR